MNCLTARQTLELARPTDVGPDDHDSRMVDEASQHVGTCPACQTAVRLQKQFDANVGAMIRDVPVPADLKGRLLVRMQAAAPVVVDGQQQIVEGAGGVASVTRAGTIPAASSSAPATAAPPAGTSGRSRRRWLAAMALAAACVVAAIGTWVLWPERPTINPMEVAADLARDDIDPDQLPKFAQFANGREPKLPATMNSRPIAGAPAYRLHTQDVAVYFFTISGAARTTLAGRLAVIPKRDVDARYLPLATSYLAGPTPYLRGYCVTSWVEGEFIYVLCLRGAADELDRLVPPNRGAA